MITKIRGYAYLETLYKDDIDVEGNEEEVKKALKLYKHNKAKKHKCKVNEIFLIIATK